ncbi:hypothetical protein EJB05_14172, partial [Eragrostis curvula]
MEFRGQQEPVHEEMGTPPAAVVPSRAPPSAAAALSSFGNGAGAAAAAPEVRYHECLRNHAAALGGHVVDGCGEFMPGTGAGDDALKCAACGCHRSFHHKDDGQQQPRRQLLLPAPAPLPPVTPTSAPRVPLLMPPPPPHPYAAGSHPHHYAPPAPLPSSGFVTSPRPGRAPGILPRLRLCLLPDLLSGVPKQPSPASSPVCSPQPAPVSERLHGLFGAT